MPTSSHSRALRIPAGGTNESAELLSPASMGAGGHDEAWLRDLLFEQPELIPMNELARGARAFIPLAREFGLSRGEAGAGGGKARVDLLGVTPHGRLVIVECKLWRNPQARREVLAQVLEYAAWLRKLSHSELCGRLKRKHKGQGQDPIYEATRAAGHEVDPALFCDAVIYSLARARFHLVVAGDGIRGELGAMMRLLDERSGLLSSVALLEISTWRAGDGSVFVMPRVATRTHVQERRVVVDPSGQPLMDAESDGDTMSEPSAPDPTAELKRAANRVFFDRVIAAVNAELSDSHPEQDPARHGGNNWIRLPFPNPATHVTAYRAVGGKVGVFFRLRGEEGLAIADEIESQRAALEQAFGGPFDLKRDADEVIFAVSDGIDATGKERDTAQERWLSERLLRVVSVFREFVG